MRRWITLNPFSRSPTPSPELPIPQTPYSSPLNSPLISPSYSSSANSTERSSKSSFASPSSTVVSEREKEPFEIPSNEGQSQRLHWFSNCWVLRFEAVSSIGELNNLIEACSFDWLTNTKDPDAPEHPTMPDEGGETNQGSSRGYEGRNPEINISHPKPFFHLSSPCDKKFTGRTPYASVVKRRQQNGFLSKPTTEANSRSDNFQQQRT